MAHIFQPDSRGGIDQFFNLDHYYAFKYTPAAGENPSSIVMFREGRAGSYQTVLLGPEADELQMHLRRLHVTSMAQS